jgi:hypothetical protein
MHDLVRRPGAGIGFESGLGTRNFGEDFVGKRTDLPSITGSTRVVARRNLKQRPRQALHCVSPLHAPPLLLIRRFSCENGHFPGFVSQYTSSEPYSQILLDYLIFTQFPQFSGNIDSWVGFFYILDCLNRLSGLP